MIDPLSITTGVSALLKLTVSVGYELKKFHDGAANIQRTLSELAHDVDSLKTVLESMRGTFANITAEHGTGHLGNLWDNVARSIEDGQTTLAQLKTVVKDIRKDTKFLDEHRKQLRLTLAEERIEEFRQHIRFFRDGLQLSLQAIILWNQSANQKAMDEILPTLDELNTNIRRVALELNVRLENLQQMVVSQHRHAQVIVIENLQQCVRAAADTISSASSTHSAEAFEDLATVAGSDFNDCLPPQENVTMTRWINRKTMHRYSEVRPPTIAPFPTPDQSEAGSDSDSDLENEMIGTLLNSGKQKSSRGDTTGAEKDLLNCLGRFSVMNESLKPKRISARLSVADLLYQLYAGQERWTEAQKMLSSKLAVQDRVEKHDEGYWTDKLNLASVLMKQGNNEKAIRQAKRAYKGLRGLQQVDGVRRCLNLLIEVTEVAGKNNDADAWRVMLEQLDQTNVARNVAELSNPVFLNPVSSEVSLASPSSSVARLSPVEHTTAPTDEPERSPSADPLSTGTTKSSGVPFEVQSAPQKLSKETISRQKSHRAARVLNGGAQYLDQWEIEGLAAVSTLKSLDDLDPMYFHPLYSDPYSPGQEFANPRTSPFRAGSSSPRLDKGSDENLARATSAEPDNPRDAGVQKKRSSGWSKYFATPLPTGPLPDPPMASSKGPTKTTTPASTTSESATNMSMATGPSPQDSLRPLERLKMPSLDDLLRDQQFDGHSSAIVTGKQTIVHKADGGSDSSQRWIRNADADKQPTLDTIKVSSLSPSVPSQPITSSSASKVLPSLDAPQRLRTNRSAPSLASTAPVGNATSLAVPSNSNVEQSQSAAKAEQPNGGSELSPQYEPNYATGDFMRSEEFKLRSKQFRLPSVRIDTAANDVTSKPSTLLGGHTRSASGSPAPARSTLRAHLNARAGHVRAASTNSAKTAGWHQYMIPKPLAIRGMKPQRQPTIVREKASNMAWAKLRDREPDIRVVPKSSNSPNDDPAQYSPSEPDEKFFDSVTDMVQSETEQDESHVTVTEDATNSATEPTDASSGLPQATYQEGQEKLDESSASREPDLLSITETGLARLYGRLGVTVDDPVRRVLPVALQMYDLEDDLHQYSIYLVYDNIERRLGLDEKPLLHFKTLSERGMRPTFRLKRNVAPQDFFTTTGEESRILDMMSLFNPPDLKD